VDWGHLGTLEMAGQEQKLHCFTFTLGYSCRMVAEAARARTRQPERSECAAARVDLGCSQPARARNNA
jgi:transposase